MSTANFSDFPLSEDLLSVIEELGYSQTTEIQAQSIPLLLEKKDLIGESKTGSGKTAAFSIPILQSIRLDSRHVQALILCPTRELCTQVAREIRKIGRRHAGLQVLIVAGGLPGRPQGEALQAGVHIVVGTPGRVLDQIRRRNMDLRLTKTLVLDEADRMLDMGFEEDMEIIIDEVPRNRQTVFFSATFPNSIQTMSRRYQRNPIHIKIEDEVDSKPSIEQLFYVVEDKDKLETIAKLLNQKQPESAIIFCNQKVTVAQVSEALTLLGVENACLHGDLEQRDRDKVMALFRNKSKRVLIATDVAARGIDVDNLELVINYNLPRNPEDYVHRIGRTGRAGRSGSAISIVNVDERLRLIPIQESLGIRIDRGTLNLFDTSSKATQKVKTVMASKMQTLVIAGGRKEKVRPGDILGALTGESGGLAGDQVGKIEIHDHFAYVAVSSAIAESALEALRGGKIKGRRFQVRFVEGS